MKCVPFYAMAVVAMGALAAPGFASTIADVTAGGAGVYTIDNAVVTDVLDVYNPAGGTAKNTFLLEDSTGGIIAYSIAQSTYTAQVGDIIDFTATNAPYQGAPELTNTAAAVTVVSQGNPDPAPRVVTTSDLAAGSLDGFPLSETLVTVKGVTLPAGTTSLTTKIALTATDAEGTVTIYPYASYSQGAAAIAAANADPSMLAGPVDITGYADNFNGVLEIYPTSITASATPEPASLGLLTLGAAAMLSRRRRKA